MKSQNQVTYNFENTVISNAKNFASLTYLLKLLIKCGLRMLKSLVSCVATTTCTKQNKSNNIEGCPTNK